MNPSELDEKLEGVIEGVEFLINKGFFQNLLEFYKELSEDKYGTFIREDCSCEQRRELVAQMRVLYHGAQLKERINDLWTLAQNLPNKPLVRDES